MAQTFKIRKTCSKIRKKGCKIIKIGPHDIVIRRKMLNFAQ